MINPFILLVFGSIATVSTSHSDSTLAEQKAIYVLFVGNSYTSVNKLPQLLEQLSAAAKLNSPIRCTMATAGGATLEKHWNNSQFRELLKSRKWDIVVLQEQSLRPLDGPDLFFEYARLWNKEIKANGAKLLFYMTWARKATLEKQPVYTENYRKAARDCGGTVVPVGEAWRVVREQKPDIELFAKDGSHPSPAGSYLAACVFYAAITDKSPVGLPGKFTVKGDGKKADATIELKPEDALCLQKAAKDAVQREKTGSGRQHSPMFREHKPGPDSGD
jgi:hypothetical protein